VSNLGFFPTTDIIASRMKQGIHPKYYNQCRVTCTCGNTFTTGATVPEIKVEICSACHPYYTGQSKYIDSEGRIERFERRRKKAASLIKLQDKKNRKKTKKKK